MVSAFLLHRSAYSATFSKRGCPSAIATECKKGVKLVGYHSSAEYPKSLGFWQALLIIQVISASEISAFRPSPLQSCNAFSIPPALYFSMHNLSVGTVISNLSAINSFELPKSFNKRILARIYFLASKVLY